MRPVRQPDLFVILLPAGTAVVHRLLEQGAGVGGQGGVVEEEVVEGAPAVLEGAGGGEGVEAGGGDARVDLDVGVVERSEGGRACGKGDDGVGDAVGCFEVGMIG